jgi:hypothetical protein
MRRLCLPFLSALAACTGGDDASTSFGSNPTAASATATATATVPTSGDVPTGGTGDVTGNPTGDPATDPDPDTGSGPGTVPGTTDNTTGFDTNPDGLPNGAECMNPADCQTGNCYVIMLPVMDLPPGICSECDKDADCVDKGLGISCSVDAATLGGMCTDGGLGSFCETQAACKPEYFCEELLVDSDPLLPHSCSECRDDADCSNGARCTPRIDISMYAGNKYCAAPGSVPNNGLCPEFTGNGVCANGHCNVINVVGMLDVGICGECGTDADCMAPKVCMPGKFSDGFFGSTCV